MNPDIPELSPECRARTQSDSVGHSGSQSRPASLLLAASVQAQDMLRKQDGRVREQASGRGPGENLGLSPLVGCAFLALSVAGSPRQSK